MTAPLFTREGPTVNETRIIGVELAVTPVAHNGLQREVELEMFSCSHTLPGNPYPYGPGHQVRVTLHTSHGDVTLRGEIRL